MTRIAAAIALLLLGSSPFRIELRVPASTAYVAPDPEGATVSPEHGVSDWREPGTSVLWFGEFRTPGRLSATVALRLPPGDSLPMTLIVAGRRRAAIARGGSGEIRVALGEFDVAVPGYLRFELVLAQRSGPATEISALILDGPPLADAHFNLDSRRNAASVHLRFPTDSSAQITGFYDEVIAVDDPVTTYYMATGFSRGYFGMQVNSPTERRIIFSVWDAANGSTARDRSTVAVDDQTQLIAKGDGVAASVFGDEGTGGHSHLVYNWKTGSTQRFFVTARPEGSHTVYTGYWFHPDRQQWQLIASFRAARDGGTLRRLYAFSEDFGDATGHLRRKALFGPQWIRLADGRWQELTTATFSHDATGKENRTDRFMGTENGRFFLSHGGFIAGFTPSGAAFARAASGAAPQITLP
jgi:Domain of unknown function (DUF3472)/Domain of unknown function (DUF5077)